MLAAGAGTARNIQIQISIMVIVDKSYPGGTAHALNTGGRSHVLERAVVFVVEQHDNVF